MAVNFILGRADKDLNEYMYKRVAEKMEIQEQQIIILVPEQFTLQAERIALEKLNVSGLIGVEILSFSRLAHKVLGEVGGGKQTHINEQGKHMVLYKIISEAHEEFEIFGNVATKHGFISLVNHLISELKQFNIHPSELKAIADLLEEDQQILKKKLRDLHLIYEDFNKNLESKYIDSEDFLNLLIGRIQKASFLKGATIWVDGFDFFNPQTLALIEKLMQSSDEVNFNFTIDSVPMCRDWDLFDVPRYTLNKCKEIAEKNHISYKTINMDEFIKERVSDIKHLEKELYTYPWFSYDDLVQNVEIFSCSSFTAELESVASKIIELVRNRGYRFRDIAVIGNDMDRYGLLISKIFAEYEIPAFIDTKRTIMHNPFVEYTLSLMDIVANGYRFEDIFRFLKTGLTELSIQECEELENYALRYGMKGNQWKKDFVFGLDELGQEILSELNKYRSSLIEFLSEFEASIKKEKSVKGKTKVLYEFIQNKTNLNTKIEDLINDLRKDNELSFVREMTQIWNTIISVLDQMVELLGDLEITMSEYANILRAGMESIEVGIIPTTVDQVLVGTLQRSRTGAVKGLFVIGVNDGIIPSDKKNNELLIFEEKEALKQMDIELSKNEDIKMKEERLAIYKTMSSPKEYLWVSYVAADSEGKEMRPSLLINRLKRILGNIEIKKDYLDNHNNWQLISTPKSTQKYLIGQIRSAMDGEELSEMWKSVFNWYLKDEAHASFMELFYSGLFYENKANRLNQSEIKALYDMYSAFSPTRLESFSRCPFEHFMRYGIRAEERKIRELAVIEMGEIFHQSLKRFAEEIINRGMSWQSIDQVQCFELMDEVIEALAEEYGEGILKRNERYAYRLLRIKRAAKKTAWILTEHVKKGKFNEFYFEVSFGRKGKFPPIEVVLPGEETVYIEGRIDRIDVLREEKDIFIKVIDYKSGSKSLNLSEVVNGLQLQLMIYLHAALKGFENSNKDKATKPAGVFYFKIDDPVIESTDIQNKETLGPIIENEIRKIFKMDGLVLKDMNVIKNMDDDINAYSDIIPVNVKKDGTIGEKSKTIEGADLERLFLHMGKMTGEICSSIMQGAIDIKPKKLDNKKTACTYCKFKTICQFDTSLAGQKYEKSDKIKLEEIFNN